MKVHAYAATERGAELAPFRYELGEIDAEQVDIKVRYCGICHSDLSMINNDWRMTQYPIVPGHEVVGEVVSTGNAVKNIKVGDKVGMGWHSAYCMSCQQCMEGEHHLCLNNESTIVNRHGGFADYVRGHWSCIIPLPDQLDISKAAPLFCGGITVFNPIVSAGVLPTDTVGVIGIGGLGHLALQFLKHWGCEVIAFSSNPDKTNEILKMGASKVIHSKDADALKPVRGKLNFLLNTTNVNLNWNAYLKTLAPKGRFQNVGSVLEPMAIPAFSLIAGEKLIGGNPVGSHAQIKTMLNFCVRHNIYPVVEEFDMNKVNEALKHLKEGKARYRIILKQ